MATADLHQAFVIVGSAIGSADWTEIRGTLRSIQTPTFRVTSARFVGTFHRAATFL